MSTLHNTHSQAADYQKLTQFYDQNKAVFFDNIHLSLAHWFDAHMAAPLGAILDLLENNVNSIIFDKIDDDIKIILQKNGFLSHFGFSALSDAYGTTIQYKKMKPTDGRFFSEYVTQQFLSRSELPVMSKGLQKKMTEAMFELFVNAQIHSETTHIYTCGQFFPTRHTIEFCIVDTGIGFRQKFTQRFGGNVTSVNAIKWALKNRHTTKVDVSGGIGLALLHEFIQLNKGKFQIISDDGFYENNAGTERTETLPNRFPGTIVYVKFCTDDKFDYSLQNESSNQDIF